MRDITIICMIAKGLIIKNLGRNIRLMMDWIGRLAGDIKFLEKKEINTKKIL